jgi:hypothetical protein
LDVYVRKFNFECFFQISEGNDQATGSEDYQGCFVNFASRRACTPAGKIYQTDEACEQDGGDDFHTGRKINRMPRVVEGSLPQQSPIINDIERVGFL